MTVDEHDDRSLYERVEQNPRPALLWLAGVVVLVALELGRFAGGAIRVGEALRTVIVGLADTPAWVEGNVAGVLGSVGGTVAFLITAAVVIAAAAVIVKWLFLPVSLVKLLGIERSAGTEDVIERAIVAAVLAVAVVLFVWTPIGALVDAAVAWLTSGAETIRSLPTLTSRELIPNQGHQTPGGGWEGTFLGLSPAWSWAIRVLVVYAYALTWLVWIWKGYTIFREHYREADWTPRDDSINRLRNHYWGLFGLIVVFMFVVMALWAPAVSPVPAQDNIYSPYDNEFEYFNEEAGEVQTTTHGIANVNSRSQGASSNVGPMSYDDYGRWSPFGTSQDGKDMFTFIAYGARVSLFIGIIATGLGAAIALILSMVSAYYRGLTDLITVVAADGTQAMPFLLIVMMLSVIFMEADHPIAQVYDGGLLLALIFGLIAWAGYWRSVRGPALQVAQEEWVDAARSYGQSPLMTMRKHMSPYIGVYMLIYVSLNLGSVIISVAALSFLGFGIQPPTPEWGRLVDQGQPFVATASWHIATIPGIMVVLIVVGFNALGDGIRDAIDPQAGGGDEAGTLQAGGGG